jgi:DNA polymerase elongation subunit (family B)
VEGLEVRWFAEEAELLQAFASHVRLRDPDLLTGWNTDGFDWPWLADAAERLSLSPAFWAGISRFRRDRAQLRKDQFRGKKQAYLHAPGRVPYDLMKWVR